MDGSNNYRLLSSSTIALLDLTQGNSVSLKMNKVGFNGTVPIAAPTPTGVTAGFTAGTGTTVVSGSTFTGNTGSTAYTIGDVVNVLKQYGMLKA